ncbi:phosphoribulokinase [Methanospirillum lacunae]|uniref:phosphoribulokinase n=1 Tax=Methanospirillum lacunae TaxID=668570 RepID=A0A2V2N0X1_9EURY|nr:phosphoribulokinase [Methanospirillum lacunae]PWR74004.1 uridine kinase [Methanospirillum lacunae]
MTRVTFHDSIQASSYIYIIGVAGDSGSGKTTFSDAITAIFGPDIVSTITLDDYHLYDRNERAQRKITPLNPVANDLDRLARDVATLKMGKPIEKPVYSHATGTFQNPITFYPTKFIILEGLHPFATPALLQHMDYTIFVDPDNEVKYDWKLRRDVGKRNYTPEAALEEIQKREPDYRRFVLPQRASAGTVIRIAYSGYSKALGISRNVYRITLGMKPPETCFEDVELNIDLCGLFTRSTHDFLLECGTLDLDNRRIRSLTIDGELSHETIHRIERNIEKQTDVHPIDIFTGKEVIAGSDLVRLIISWQIINHRIHIDSKQLKG